MADNIEDVLQPDTFNFLDVLAERSFPKNTVSVYLDEASAYKMRDAKAKLRLAETDAEKKKIAKEIEALRSEINKSEYKFYLAGVSFERIESLIDLAKEKFPIETKTRKTASGALEQYEVPNAQREEYLGFLTLWVHVESIEAPDGRSQVSPDIDTIIGFIKKAPQSQVERFANACRELQVSSYEFEEAIDDDFLAKS